MQRQTLTRAAIGLALVGLILSEGWLATSLALDPQTAHYTLWQIRLPRYLLSLLLGAALGMAGCVLQSLSGNNLADPEVLGINQGASLAVVTCLLLLGQSHPTMIMLAAFCGGLLGGSLVYALAFHGQATPAKLLLAGLAVAFLCGSLTAGIILVRENQLFEILHWMAGKLSGSTWTDVKTAAWLLPTFLLGFLGAYRLNVLRLGQELAAGLGQAVVRTRLFFLLLCLGWVAVGVALAGPIGFVGLMVPHLGRAWVGEDHRLLLPACALCGAALLGAADLAAFWLLRPAETPVGVLTALLGAPFFLQLARRLP